MARQRSLYKLSTYPKMTWMAREGDDVERILQMIADNLAGPGWLYGMERHFWLDLWRVPVFEAVEEDGIEARHYGPVRAFVIAGAPREPMFNLVLGATAPGAITDGHLPEALDWTESLGLDCRVPVRPDFGEPAAVEEHLNQRGYRRTAFLAMFVRGGDPPDFPQPPGIEVEEITEEIEGFDDIFADGDLFWTGSSFFPGLPGRREWRSYIAFDDDGALGAATMMQHFEVSQLGFAATYESSRCKGTHMALLRRRIVDAIAARSRRLFAVTEEPLDYPESSTIAARNLVRAGFWLDTQRTVWRPPEHLLAPGEDELDEDEEYGPDYNHDFEFEH